MARSEAITGFGAVLEIALASDPTNFTYIGETLDNSPPTFTYSTIEVTHSQSPGRNREYKAGLGDTGSSTHSMNYVPGSTTDRFLQGLGGKDLVVNLTWPTGVKQIYNAVLESYEPTASIDDRATASLSLKVSGQPVTTPQAAPRNIVLPSVDDTTPVVGVPIVVDQGVWAGAENWEYQWQGDGVDIAGATFSSFVPTAAQLGEVLTCEVTGSNSGFTTTAETAGTTAVAAS